MRTDEKEEAGWRFSKGEIHKNIARGYGTK